MGLFRMDPENSGILGLYHIEFNHLPVSLSFYLYGLRSFVLCKPHCAGMQRTLSGFETDWKEAKKERTKRKPSATI